MLHDAATSAGEAASCMLRSGWLVSGCALDAVRLYTNSSCVRQAAGSSSIHCRQQLRQTLTRFSLRQASSAAIPANAALHSSVAPLLTTSGVCSNSMCSEALNAHDLTG